jgi:hypothetical protein
VTALTDLEVEAVGVGDVRMVRTFRIGPAGQLYPVNSIDAWADGWNTARCGRGKTHAPPGPNCRCGFYLYSDPAYALAQPPARQVMAVVATHGAMEIGSRGARASRARVEALWLGPRVSDQLAQALRERYPTVTVLRDRTIMDQLFPLTHLDGFVTPRVSERTRRRLRPVMWAFLTAVVLLGCIPTRLTLASSAGTALWLSLIVGSLAIMLTGLLLRSSVVGLQGSASIAWLITAGPQTPVIWAMRGPFVVLMASAMLIWRRAGLPGRTVRTARLDQGLRRWRGRFPTSG